MKYYYLLMNTIAFLSRQHEDMINKTQSNGDILLKLWLIITVFDYVMNFFQIIQ